MTDEDKKIHDFKFELRQLRLRLDEDEMKIKKLEDDLANAKKTVINLMLFLRCLFNNQQFKGGY